MESNNYFEELIVSYLSNNLDEEEEEYIRDWINSSEQNKQYFEELRKTWSALSVKQIDVNRGWSRFVQAKNTSLEKKYGESNNKLITDNTDDDTNRHGKTYKLFIQTAVAASIIFVIVFSVSLTNNRGNITAPIAAEGVKKIIVEQQNLEYQFNTSAETRKVVLADGSEVTLYPNSNISYNKPFLNNRRDISLTGKADFKVAKDKSKPFTVIGGNIATTAIGTIFTVTAFDKSENVIVRLLAGKVIVKSSDHSVNMLKQNYFLLPGQEFIYIKKKGVAVVRPFLSRHKTFVSSSKKERLLKDDPSIPEVGKEGWFMFNNQQLEDVLEQLERMFETDIVYNKKELSKIYFVGKFNESDSLDEILKQIASATKLKVTKKNNRFIISK
jgi:ferric-dicitrate binding protein FerR (iron transport regulator)